MSKPWGRFFQILCVSQKVRTLLMRGPCFFHNHSPWIMYNYQIKIKHNFLIFSGIFAPVNSYFTVASHISLCASVLMIVALSHERYFAICSPHIYRIHMRSVSRWKHLAKYIVPVVLVSIICNIPMLINIIDREILKNPIYVKVRPLK